MKEFPEYENVLRDIFLITSSNRVPDKSRHLSVFHSFKLNLPLEAPLLPHLINALLTSHRRYHHEIEDGGELEYINEQVIKMVDDVIPLRDLAYDCNQEQVTRAAAVLALLLHPDEPKKLGDMKHLLVQFYNPEVGSWYVNAITFCLRLLTEENNPDAKWIVSSLLEASRIDYEARQHIQSLLAFWRESSYAPVQEADVQEKWLLGM